MAHGGNLFDNLPYMAAFPSLCHFPTALPCFPNTLLTLESLPWGWLIFVLGFPGGIHPQATFQSAPKREK